MAAYPIFRVLDAAPVLNLDRGDTAKADLKPPESRRDSSMGGEQSAFDSSYPTKRVFKL
jgi:hypothetical protein